MSLKRHNKICSDVKVPDEDFFDEESKKIADEIEIEEDVPIINIFQMIEKSAFEEIEGKRNVHFTCNCHQGIRNEVSALQISSFVYQISQSIVLVMGGGVGRVMQNVDVVQGKGY